jgi:ABC-type multidrug transport system fused ATPase/permease subunit
MKLLLRLYEFEHGEIEVYGKPIKSYDLEAYRDLVAYVPQDSYLFDGSIRDNIGFGKPGAGDGEIKRCAQAANAHAFIAELPDGYDAQVGERGIHLSVGQRQRVAIARALLKDAPLLILDEATASLDSESENEVQKALEVLMEDRTSIVIAHRLSTIQKADRIVVIEKGRIQETGSHEELLSRGGRYAELHAAQSSSERLKPGPSPWG